MPTLIASYVPEDVAFQGGPETAFLNMRSDRRDEDEGVRQRPAVSSIPRRPAEVRAVARSEKYVSVMSGETCDALGRVWHGAWDYAVSRCVRLIF